MAIKLDLVCFKLSFSNSRRSQPLFAALWILQVTVMKWLLMPWVSLRPSFCEVGWHSCNKYYCLNALFWPIFDGIVNHKHHDFDVNKSERDDYGHYWTISESDLDLKTSAVREWASRACLLVGGPLLTLWPTFELREKYSKSSLIWTRIKPTLEISTWLIWSFALARFLRSFKDLNCFSIVSVCLRGGQSQQIYFYSNKHFLVSEFSVSRHF